MINRPILEVVVRSYFCFEGRFVCERSHCSKGVDNER